MVTVTFSLDVWGTCYYLYIWTDVYEWYLNFRRQPGSQEAMKILAKRLYYKG